LQEADILIYKAHLVPVGKDQDQHLKLSKNIVSRFNNKFGMLFSEPTTLFSDDMKLLSLADPSKKMSKSLGEKNYIGIYEDETSIRNKVLNEITISDSNDHMPSSVSNFIQILRACQKNELENHFDKKFYNGTVRYSDLKTCVADALI
jgi:tryptophanyl-tRNA synthetase